MLSVTRIMWKLALLVLCVLAGFMFVAVSGAQAADGAAVDAPAVSFQLDWIMAVSLLVSLVLPAVVAFVTTRFTQSRTKVLLLFTLNAITAAGSELLRTVSEGGTYDAGAAVLTFVAGLIVSWVSYDQAWKKAGITTETVGRGRVPAADRDL